jgi:hypothetical protein
MPYGTVNADAISTSSGAILGAGDSSSMKNRIINGAMVIDQRNAGASVTANDSVFPVDRWKYETSQSSKGTSQQNQGSVTPPAGFSNYLGFTSSSAYSVLSSDYFWLEQFTEGFNTADFNWGTSNAATVTLSFWVRSSLTGTFGGSLTNNSVSRCFPFSYTINTSNTWEQKSITIVGDTSGTWVGATNGNSIRLHFSLGTGSTRVGGTSAWGSTDYRGGLAGSQSVVGTNGATFYITGVQLEKGSTATSFDYRPYGTELQLCQRYCYVSIGANSLVAGAAENANRVYIKYVLPVPMRASPSLTVVGSVGQPLTISDQYITDFGASSPVVVAAPSNNEISGRILLSGFTGLTTGRWYGGAPNALGSMTYNAEL